MTITINNNSVSSKTKTKQAKTPIVSGVFQQLERVRQRHPDPPSYVFSVGATRRRRPGQVRFVKGEEDYLSPTHGGPRMYLNIEDYYTHSTRYSDNPRFAAAVRVLRSGTCGGRLHWGKAGWPQFAAPFDGAQEYSYAWCDFGCAVRELDPEGKFAGLAPVWKWDGADLEACCSSQGFSRACACGSAKNQE